MGAYWRGGPIQMSALAAVDMALWDIKGKAAGMPVYALLGGPTRTSVLTYYHAHGNTYEEVADDIIQHKTIGFKVIRAQVAVEGQTGGYGAESAPDPAQQIAHEQRLPYEGIWEPEPYLQSTPRLFSYLRETVGWDIQLLHDVHGRLTPIEAARLAKDLEPFKLMFLEDPIGPEHFESLHLIRQASTTPIAIGEVISSKHQILPMITAQTIDYMRCSPIHIGGITEAKKLAAIAEPFEIKTAFHGPGDVSPIGDAAAVHVDMAIQNFGIQEWIQHPERVREVIPGGPYLDHGYLKIDSSPGLGVDINEELAARYPYQRHYLPIPRREDGSVQGY
jgi:mannonate dehydratase